ncbi:hypothetical protein JCM16303_003686 [Sporobolomyces ruberrimus]
MAHLVHFDHVDPFASARKQSPPAIKGEAGGFSTTTKGNGKFGSSQPVGLAVRYEGSPYDRHEIRVDDMGWDRNDVPIPRANKSKRNTRGPRDTRMSVRPQSTRVDSVLDVYAELYSNEDEEEESAPTFYGMNQSRHEDLIPYQPVEQATQPWDERGKNGLYGGGGVGADDRETGWVRGYSIGSSAPSVGLEEDLKFDDYGVTHRHPSDDDEDVAHRSSSDTAQSGSYPVTPTSSHFPTSPPAVKTMYDSPPSATSPPRSAGISSSSHSRTPSASQTPFRTPERPLRTESPARDLPLSSSDVSLLRMKGPQPTSFPSPSAPLPAFVPTETPSPAAIASPSRPAGPKRSNSIFKRYGRSKKQPPISAPIIPDGFVESLGMKTFTLTPGCKAPAFGDTQANGAVMTAPPTPKTPDRPSLPLNYGPRLRDSPRPRESPSSRSTPPRPPSTSRSHSSNPSIASKKSPSPPRAFQPSVHRSSDVYPHEAMARLSMGSDSSVHSDPTGPNSNKNPTHRQFFDQLRQERSNPHEVTANTRSAKLVTNDSIPSIPLRPAQVPYGGDLSKRPTATGQKGGFERAWGSAAAVSKEDERGSTVHYDARGGEDDSGQSTYSDHTEFGSRRPSSTNLGHAPPSTRPDVSSYYSQAQPTSRDTRYDLEEETNGAYDRSSQFEMLDEDYARYGAGPIQPLNFTAKSTPPPVSAPSVTPRGLAHFNRGGGKAGAQGQNRGSTIDPLSSFAGVKKNRVQAGPAIGVTGFRNPFG